MEDFFKDDPLSDGTKGLVFVGDEVLIYRRDNNTTKWPLLLDVPGGGRENNESPFETFKRELKEEFNLDISKADIAYAKRYPSGDEEGKFGWYTVAKLPQHDKRKIVFGDEGLEYFLMPFEDFMKRKDTIAHHRQRVIDYAESIMPNKDPV